MQGAHTSSPKLYQKHNTNINKVYQDANNDLPYFSGNSLLTPKAEFYKNLVENYKKKLEGLNTGENQNQAVKNTIDFLNRQHQAFGYGNVQGKHKDDKIFRHNNENSNPILKNLPYLDKDGNVVNKSPDRRKEVIDNEYATAASIIQNAKTEKFMLDYEKFKYRPKKESFQHEATGKHKINSYFQQINDQIDGLASQYVHTTVESHKKDFIQKYNQEMENLQ